MPNETVLKKKKEQVSAIKESVESSSAVVFADYRGLSVKDISDLRSKLRAVDTRMTVYKNTLLSLALKELSIDVDSAFLSGPTAVVSIQEDAALGAKEFYSFSKQFEQLQAKGGLLGDKVLTSDDIKHLATLPSKQELLGKVVGGIKAPITGLHATLSSPLRGFVLVLKAIKEQKTGGE